MLDEKLGDELRKEVKSFETTKDSVVVDLVLSKRDKFLEVAKMGQREYIFDVEAKALGSGFVGSAVETLKTKHGLDVIFYAIREGYSHFDHDFRINNLVRVVVTW